MKKVTRQQACLISCRGSPRLPVARRIRTRDLNWGTGEAIAGTRLKIRQPRNRKLVARLALVEANRFCDFPPIHIADRRRTRLARSRLAGSRRGLPNFRHAFGLSILGTTRFLLLSAGR